MLPLRTERTNVAGRLVHKAMPYHFVLPFKSFAAFRAAAGLHRAIMVTGLGVYVCVGAAAEDESAYVKCVAQRERKNKLE